MVTKKNIFRIAVSVLTFALTSLAASAADRFVAFDKGDMLLCKKGGAVSIVVSDNDNVAVKLAAKNLAKDLNAIVEAKVEIQPNESGNATKIIVGTIGKSKAIDALVKSGKIDGKALKGKIEKYILTICDGSLIIAGSDRRGTVYGIYELSQQAGVSPWYYWMDVPVRKQEAIYINNGIYTDGEPAVR